MKKIFITLSLLFALPVSASFDKDLYYGIQGDSDVSALQEFLTDEGLYSGPITGNFYSLTFKAVKSFQTREGITPSAGYFGPKTRVKVNTLLSVQTDASNQQAIQESGSAPEPIPIPKTNNDVVSKLQEQISALMSQISLLQQQATLQGAIEQKLTEQNQKIETQNQIIQQQQTTIDQIQQNTQQIAENTTPAPPAPIPEPIPVPATTISFGNVSLGPPYRTFTFDIINNGPKEIHINKILFVKNDDTTEYFSGNITLENNRGGSTTWSWTGGFDLKPNVSLRLGGLPANRYKGVKYEPESVFEIIETPTGKVLGNNIIFQDFNF